jgi:MFS family permease
MRPRLPPTSRSLKNRINIKFMTTSTFMLLQLCNTIQGLGFFLPSIYLPSYAASIGASPSVGSLSVLLYNIASTIGCVLMGAIIDKYDVTTCSFLSTVGSTIGVFVIWGFSTSLTPLFIFAVEYGIFAGSWVATWPGIVRAVTQKTNSADPSTVLAWIATGRGLGNVISGPLSEALLQGSPWKGQAQYGYGSGYGTVIVFTGITALLSGASFVGRRVGWI